MSVQASKIWMRNSAALLAGRGAGVGKNLSVAVLAATLQLGCSSNNLPKYNLISSLRVLALKTSTPEISPGDVIPSVTALVMDPNGAGRPVSYAWVGCLEMLTASTTRYECVNAPDRISLGSGTASSIGPPVPASVLDALPGYLAYNGVNYIISLTVTADQEKVVAFKRIVISSSGHTPKNHSPVLNAIQREGVTLNNADALGSGDQNLSLVVDPASFESYTYQDGLGNMRSATEDLLVTWFYTEGSMKQTRTFGGNLSNVWTAPGSKLRSSVTLGVVVHDGRGGVDWKTVDLQ